MPRLRLQPLLIFAAILAGAVAIHWPALRHARPFCCDNIAIFEWVDGASLRDALVGNPLFPLEWRPIPHLLVLAEYSLWGVTPLAPYLVVNLIIWSACISLVFALTRRLTGSAVGAAVAAGYLLTARQTVAFTEFLMETQTAFACLFGLVAVSLALRERPPSARATAAIAVLLFAACLGKEYGLAFAAGVAVWAALRQQPGLALGSAAAVAVYLVLRASLTISGAACEQQAFFSSYREVCLGQFDATALTQMAYNAAAGLLHTVSPGFLGSDGLIGIAPLRLVQTAFWLVFITLGFRRAPWVTLAVLVILANAALQAPLYRSRNTIVGLTMVALLVGSGFTVLLARLRSLPWMVPARLLPVAVLAALAVRAVITSGNVSLTARHTEIQDPCVTVHQPFPVDAGFVRRLKTAYGLPDPDCTQPAVERVLEDTTDDGL